MWEKEIFGEIVQEERKAQKISQERMAQLTGLDRTFISLIENGKRCPTLTTILKISAVLKIPASELLAKLEARCPECSDRTEK